MKRFFKIFGITLASVTGIALIAVCWLLYVVFTPERLTPIVDGLAGKYLSCDHRIGSVELTVFSTFPHVGIRANDLTLINVTAGAPSDTVAHVKEATGIVNIQHYLDHKSLEINSLVLDGVKAMIYTDSLGNSNYLVFRSDTTAADTSSEWPFAEIKLERIEFGSSTLHYLDLKRNISAVVCGTEIDLAGSMHGDSLALGDLAMVCDSVSVIYDGRQYLSGQPIALKTPFRARLDSMALTLDEAVLALDDYTLTIDGSAAMPTDTISLDVNVAGNQSWAIDTLLALAERNMPGMLPELDVHGNVNVAAHVYGEYYDNHLPLVTAHVRLADGSGSYKGIPYKLNDVNADADVVLDLNDRAKSGVVINSAEAKTRQSALKARGKVTELFGDMMLDLHADADLHLPDVADYLPKNMAVSGRATGPVDMRTRLSNLTGKRFDRMNAKADVHLTAFDMKYDDITAHAPVADVGLLLPSGNSKAAFANITLQSPKLKAAQGGVMQAEIDTLKLTADVNNLTESNLKSIIADARYDFGRLKARYDNIDIDAVAPQGTAYVDYDTKDSKALPHVNATLKGRAIDFVMDTVSAHIKKPDIGLELAGQQHRKDLVKASVQYNSGEVKATMGSQMDAQLASLKFNGSVKQDDQQFDFLNIWNPNLNIRLSEGWANFALLPYRLEIPTIDFNFTPDNLVIADSRIRLGNSDFGLKGNVTELNRWLGGEANLGGELNFTSNYTDVNQLMDLTSGFGDKDSTETSADDMSDGDPFMVPKGVDLVLHTRIHKAAIGRQIANELGGNLYINDGTLVLEEMGFICKAAHLQLTALYKTPRRNHIYAGVDLHMLDIHIAELIEMIPDAQEMLPMLSSFSGKAEFHLALETYMNDKYELKTSTSIGAASLQGKDLVLLDSETFTQIAKLLMFRKKTENLVDSISAEITLWNRQVDIYPFMMSIDKYAAAVGGQHNLDGTYDYHISLVRPLAIGVNVKTGDDKKLHIKPTLPKYNSSFEPVRRNSVEAQNLKLREQIRAALKKNVKI